MTAVLSAWTEKRLWTAGEFLDWLEPGRHADLINGEIFMHSPVNLRHARLLNFMDRLLAVYIEPRGLGELHREVVAVRLTSRDVFLPDLCFFRPDQVALFAASHIPVVPTFVVEALSPWSEDRDLGPKFAAYEVHGVDEYWVLDPDRLGHRFFRREGENLIEFGTGEDVVRSASIEGFRVHQTWLNPDALPPVAECLASLA